eukprot:TRINITY_DN3182_c0_g1_i3.p1 TRINITY_DN3182_c0_g1~~TRINITY_DN3182_c0_g1_i3.p1  ORF type:complete len:333 (-),score=72.01 TRINITY_DN3182_c0_g1_i3:255-1253(-)
MAFMGFQPLLVLVAAHLASQAGAAVDISRPWSLSRASLNFAREEGTGTFYTTGTFKGTMTLAHKDICTVRSCFKVPSLKMKSSGLNDIWLAKYNSRNQLLWAKKAGGVGEDVAESIAISNVRYPTDAPYNDIFITGTIQGKAWFDTTKTVSALSANTKSIYIAKYNTSNGEVRYTKLAATCGTTQMHSDLGERVQWKDTYSHCNSRAIGLDSNGDVVITGKFFGTLNFDGNTRLVSGTNCRVRAATGRVCEHSVFIAKFGRETGAFKWADKITDPIHIKTFSTDIKTEFKTWADRAVTLFQRLDDTDDTRVDDNWPLGTDGQNTNLYRTRDV